MNSSHSIINKIFLGICIITSLTFGYFPFNSSTGDASYDELKLPGHTRQAGLSGAGGAISLNPNEVSHTPLALTLADSYFIAANTIFAPKEINATIHTMYAGTRLNSFNIAFGGAYTNYADLQGRDTFGEKTSRYSAQSFHLNGALSSDSSQYRWAIECSYAFNALDNYSSHAVYSSVAFGTTFGNSFHTAVLLSNLGYSTSFNSRETKLPTTLTFSAGQTFTVANHITTHTLLDIKKINEEPLHSIVGQELILYKMIILRGGYNFHTDQSWAIGGGLHILGYQIDYAYQNHSALNGYHHTAIGLTF